MNHVIAFCLALAVGGCNSDGRPDPDPADPSDRPDAASGSDRTDAAVAPDLDEPVILVHGIRGSSADFDTMRQRLADGGFANVHVIDFDSPSWGCNVDNAEQLSALIDQVLAESGAPRVDIVAHSMGSLSTRYFLKMMQGANRVDTFVSLGGMHHGLDSSCSPDFPFKPCVWDELCSSGEFIAELNADPATPGELAWVSIAGTADDTVPSESSWLEGAENISVARVGHDGPEGLQESPEVYAHVERALRYPAW